MSEKKIEPGPWEPDALTCAVCCAEWNAKCCRFIRAEKKLWRLCCTCRDNRPLLVKEWKALHSAKKD